LRRKGAQASKLANLPELRTLGRLHLSGGHGHAVLVFEPELGSNLYISFRDPNTGREVRRSLSHKDWKLAVRQAEELSAQFLLGVRASAERW
jgi:hypothetical protein